VAGGVRLEVRDDGVGGARLDTGGGLRGLRDRVEALDGRLELRSPPSHGTLLAATIPTRSR
jgi:signal transduction histidine kinase